MKREEIVELVKAEVARQLALQARAQPQTRSGGHGPTVPPR